MPYTNQPSESMVGSLCREMARLRQHWQQLSGLLGECRDDRLILRLGQEAIRLQRRRLELQQLAHQVTRLPLRDPLAAAFLLEICSRPLACGGAKGALG